MHSPLAFSFLMLAAALFLWLDQIVNIFNIEPAFLFQERHTRSKESWAD
jgi:hypothetical protein